MSVRPARSTVFLIALLAGSGVLHFVRTEPFVAIVPKMLPRKEELVYLSGAAELIGAALMAAPKTRRFGGMWSAALLAAVFPANISMAMRAGKRPVWFQVALWVRLPLQLPLIRWAWRAGR